MPLFVSCAAGGRLGAGLFVALEWCWRVDSNHRPTDYESVALPAELRQPAPRARRVSPYYISGKTGDRPPFSSRQSRRTPAAENRGLSPVLLGLRARADDDVHAVGDRALRQRRKSEDADIVGGNVGEPSRHNIVEMMMRFGVRVVHDFGRINDQLPDQFPLQEQFQRV